MANNAVSWQALTWEQKQAVITYGLALACDISDIELLNNIREKTHDFLEDGKNIRLSLQLKCLLNKILSQLREKRRTLPSSEIDHFTEIGFKDLVSH